MNIIKKIFAFLQNALFSVRDPLGKALEQQYLAQATSIEDLTARKSHLQQGKRFDSSVFDRYY